MIYLADDFRCHIDNDGGGAYTPWEDATGFFAGKCCAFVEGYRVVPQGASWTRPDGTVFEGLMIVPAVDIEILLAAQSGYEELLPRIEALTAAQDALLGTEVNGDA